MYKCSEQTYNYTALFFEPLNFEKTTKGNDTPCRHCKLSHTFSHIFDPSVRMLSSVFSLLHSRLQTFVDAIASYVIENAPDLMSKEFDREGVKLHATLMNSKFPVKRAEKAAESEGKKGGIGGDWSEGKKGGGGDWRRRKPPEPERRKRPEKVSFDATRIFKV